MNEEQNYSKAIEDLNTLIAKNRLENIERHDELMAMVKPLYDTFIFTNQVKSASMRFLVVTTKVCGFILAVLAVGAAVWSFIKWIIFQAK